MSDDKTDLPEPLVPADVDLRQFPYLPLDAVRLRDSDLAMLATGEEFKAAVLLWCAAWHQSPPASLPDDDRSLARYSGAGAAWKKVKAMALRGFVLCRDGRLYHPVLAEKALDGWHKKLRQKERTANATLAREQKRRGAQDHRDDNDLITRDDERNVEAENQRDDERNVHQEKRREEKRRKAKAAAASVTPTMAGEPASDDGAAAKTALPGKTPAALTASDPVTARALELALLLRQRGAALTHHDPNVRKWAAAGVTDAQALDALDTALARRDQTRSTAPIGSGYLGAILSDAVGSVAAPAAAAPAVIGPDGVAYPPADARLKAFVRGAL